MFYNILVKSFQIGEKSFHLLCDPRSNQDEIEKVGLEIIKISQQIRADFEKKNQEEKPIQEPPKPEEAK